MRALGIEITGSDSLLVILDGNAKNATIEIPSPSRLPLPPDTEQVNRLIALKRQIQDIFKLKHIDHIGLVRADKGCSPIRAKIECMIQVAAAEVSIPCKLVASQTVAAAEKRRVQEIAEPHLLSALGEISPGYLRKAAYSAWSRLNDEQ